MRVLAAPDKFRDSVTASEVAAAISRAVRSVGGQCIEMPVADGGEGTLDVLGGANRQTLVTGPLGDPVLAGWRLNGTDAVIEMARASGLALVGGPDGNDPVAASTTGTGELIAEAVESGARRVIIGMGGSATTDGGFGALRAMYPLQRLRGVELIVACDVRTRFVDAAEVFAPQKGASPAQVKLLQRRLERLAQLYADEYGVDVRILDRSGAAGGLAGGLAAIGARLVDGFELVAEELGLYERISQADLVVTGEGFLDAQSFEGKAVGGVAELAAAAGVPVLAVVGDIYDGAEHPGLVGFEAVSLVRNYGVERSFGDPVGCIEALVADLIAERMS
ncbi:MAG TPA: glycerate kinase [Acidimicrobiales bacterium]